MSPASHFFFVRKPKNSTEKKSVCRKNPRLFSDINSVISNKFLLHASSIYCIYRMQYRMYCICCMRSHAIACDIAFVTFIACDNAGGAVLGNVVRPDDFERRVLHDVHRRRCGGGGGRQGRRRGLDGAAEARCRRRHESAAAASAVGRRGGEEPRRRLRRRQKRRRLNNAGRRPQRCGRR